MAGDVLEIESESDLRAWLGNRRCAGEAIGVVPTMGALHEGHLSLIRCSRESCDRTIVTIFVNPKQFGPSEDLSRYPRTYEQDLHQLRSLDVDAVFVPSVETMYPAGFSTYIEPPLIAERWEGECRPGHFRGVTTVVLKLLNLIPADIAFFGEKDFQQCRVIENMCRDLNLGIKIQRCPTVREADGLAMSSRNQYLSPEERRKAVALSEALHLAARLAREQHGVREILQAVESHLRRATIEHLEYVSLVDSISLEPLEPLERLHGPARLLLAAYVGTTRLIDNAEIGED